MANRIQHAMYGSHRVLGTDKATKILDLLSGEDLPCPSMTVKPQAVAWKVGHRRSDNPQL